MQIKKELNQVMPISKLRPSWPFTHPIQKPPSAGEPTALHGFFFSLSQIQGIEDGFILLGNKRTETGLAFVVNTDFFQKEEKRKKKKKKKKFIQITSLSYAIKKDTTNQKSR
jgi:hypothetical protein